ncbi:VOC family protein [Shewanella sp. HN-41]|uniref:VOC family protein n=1 Tax=Shewanella sp. HN-41 TaxID=327275 RepID=UPI0002125BA5|nr:VOC family protein [Shewanella sp. HN-41]EGM68853.1 glyoxalase family protein [Shewanella sp. HN-41]
MFIPPGFALINPYMIVDNAQLLVDFLSQAFDAEVIHLSHRPDGKIANALIQISGYQFMVSEATAVFPAMPASYYLYVEDADESVQQAVTAGAALIMAVTDKPYGDRQGGVRDPVGNLWWISQRLAAGPYQD